VKVDIGSMIFWFWRMMVRIILRISHTGQNTT